MDEYEREYRGHVRAAEEKLDQAERGLPDQRRALIGSAERATEAARDVVQLMELEARSLSGAARTKLQSQLRTWRDEVSTLKARAKDLRSTARTPQQQDRIREECFSGSDRYRDEAGERDRMLSNNERLSKGTDRLKDAHQVTLDMENTANSILGDLSRQRETMMHARGTLRFAADGLDTSTRILSQMARRAAMNKFTLYVVIALLLGMLLILWMSGGGAEPAAADSQGGAAAGAGFVKVP
jgi:vesicle transport through interaction with t-SNAREs protein 1